MRYAIAIAVLSLAVLGAGCSHDRAGAVGASAPKVEGTTTCPRCKKAMDLSKAQRIQGSQILVICPECKERVPGIPVASR